jgi:hypothetical protein
VGFLIEKLCHGIICSERAFDRRGEKKKKKKNQTSQIDGNNPASCVGGPGFKSWPRDWLFWNFLKEKILV